MGRSGPKTKWSSREGGAQRINRTPSGVGAGEAEADQPGEGRGGDDLGGAVLASPIKEAREETKNQLISNCLLGLRHVLDATRVKQIAGQDCPLVKRHMLLF